MMLIYIQKAYIVKQGQSALRLLPNTTYIVTILGQTFMNQRYITPFNTLVYYYTHLHIYTHTHLYEGFYQVRRIQRQVHSTYINDL